MAKPHILLSLRPPLRRVAEIQSAVMWDVMAALMSLVEAAAIIPAYSPTHISYCPASATAAGAHACAGI